jgi:decaprenylphospho-beta-D-erythro-pentofuranosid-2-ulose 2-reductase
MATVMILGARSDIGLAVAHQFAKHGCDIQLAGRKIDHSQSDRLDLMVRYQVGVTLHEFDVLATETHPTFVDKLPVLPDIVVCAIGYLGDQPLGQNNGDTFTTIVRTNYEGPAAILGVLANKFESRGSGTLIGISSVAGLRGRASNYIYGSAKAGFTAFLSGLRNRLSKSGVRVITVLPGFVHTKMIADIETPKLLTATRESLAKAIYASAQSNRDIVIYHRWRLIMAVICLIPERIFKRLSL